MKKFIGLAALAVALAGSGAYAADLRDSLKDDAAITGARVNWAGVYAAVQGGYGSTTAGLEDSQGGISADGLIGGARVGIDITRGDFLVGVYGEYNLGGQSLDFGPITLVQQDDDWAAMVRVGLIRGKTLFYVAGGYTEVTFSAPAFGSGDATVSGWKLAGGIEHMIAANTTFALEASYAALDPNDISTGLASVIDIDDFRVMGRLSYKINSSTFGY